MTTRQEAINLKCKECAYDELDDGTWRQKVERCEITDCPLWKYKPKSRSKASSVAHSVAVQPHFGGYMRNVGVGQGYHPTPLTFLLIKYIIFTQRRGF